MTIRQFPALFISLLLVCSCHLRERIIGKVVDDFMEGISEAMTPSSDPLNSGGKMELPALRGYDVVVFHTGYALSFNPEYKIPEWVAYELTAEELEGDLDRDEMKFQMDPKLKLPQAMREDYAGSGWTRGHMASAGDFEWDSTAMEETFYLTNVCPQSEALNRGDWNYLEKKVRNWAIKYGKVWIVTGPIVGTGKYGTIGDRDVAVPDAFYKAVLVSDGDRFHSIAFVMGNDDKRYYLADCAITVNELEELTGLDFFPLLPDSVEEKVESSKELRYWNIKTR